MPDPKLELAAVPFENVLAPVWEMAGATVGEVVVASISTARAGLAETETWGCGEALAGALDIWTSTSAIAGAAMAAGGTQRPELVPATWGSNSVSTER